MSGIKERPILFSGAMVKAILDGKKTQTRRVIKPKPLIHDFGEGVSKTALEGKFVRNGMTAVGCDIANQAMRYVNCPYGNKGDRLWVRETWQHSNFPFGPLEEGGDIFYRADYLDDPLGPDLEKSEDGIRRKWKPSIHIPRWASRINLEITGIRVELLQDITDKDAIAEGIQLIDHNYFKNYLVDIYQSKNQKGVYAVDDPIMSYASLFESINGNGSWDINPWIWVIEFRRLE